jgi:hypothetical protein
MTLRSAAALVAALLAPHAAGCGPSSPDAASPNVWDAPSKGDAAASSGLPVERYFPMVDGHIYSYRTMGESGDEGLLVARVVRHDAGSGELTFPSGGKRFEYTAEGVRIASGANAGAFVLKTPLSVGQSWRGEHGGQTRIDATDVAIQLPAGDFQGCLRTVEERGGDVTARYVTVFCPDVGVVSLEATAGMSFERAELMSYAAPVDLGPEGVRRIE